jgi:predicted RNase H-like HicB family nuclease
MRGYRFSVIVAKDIKGWEAYCPDFPDCRARGSSYEDAVSNLKDLVQVLVEDGLGDDETVPQPDELRFTAMELAL